MSVTAVKLYAPFILAALACATSAALSACGPVDGWTTAWEDNFDGNELDLDSWNIIEGQNVGACRYAWCQADNVVVANGTLTLTAKRQSVGAFEYTSGAVDTKGKRHWVQSPTYRFCANAKLPGNASAPAASNKGLWPAIWLMPDTANDHSCDPDEGEMDVLEMVSGQGAGFATYHWQTTFPARNCTYPVGHEEVYAQTPIADWDTQFHEYAVERSATHIAFIYDGVVVLNRSSTGPAPAPLLWPYPFYAILNLAIGGTWPGNATDATVFPVQHVIDYVRVVMRA